MENLIQTIQSNAHCCLKPLRSYMMDWPEISMAILKYAGAILRDIPVLFILLFILFYIRLVKKVFISCHAAAITSSGCHSLRCRE
ncbi:Hypothetical protein GbCGDNIH9_5084 [Granulibacter bethesdensis]|uniref:Uncharacterized protein n=1 Tax=Granulibacter bethesdensis TaxID=364410 RepID=A0AAC9K774_9PROT|nr:Hypothetical protein GbCGDNIH9_5084 [Granulibacter bethesdensis]APH62157.1 Hypothetical protein GbCGDNIH8_8549 [Granulibacter bethesdensis]